eukprot:2509388-Rhodomonas_salina.1
MLVIACLLCLERESVCRICRCVLDVEDGACLLLAHARGVLLAVSTGPGPGGSEGGWGQVNVAARAAV